MAIKVGQKHPKTVKSEDIGAVKKKQRELAKQAQAPKPMSKEQRERLLKTCMELPEDKRVQFLRDVGLNADADDYQKYLAEENLKKNQAKQRQARLQEIKAMPLEDQLPLLLEEGYDEEAKELSERLAKANGEENGDGDGDHNEAPAEEEAENVEQNDGGENAGDGDGAGQSADGTEAEKKKPGRPKKTAE